MRIHYLLFTFLLVLLSPLAAFSQKVNRPLICRRKGGKCYPRSCPDTTHPIGNCAVFFKCCNRQ
ncbi:beta-defensin 8-like [Mus caroli]|uniref:Beta-defensin 8-like n=1 Tax=Mus caroli TaxID=10089 RepID=A0A6P5P7T2_MUSCR|nr:beta-defensin 8-like [Mus caroli]